jgi:hypothetical protein
MNYRKLIKGKRVIFVGACPNIKGKGFAEMIDSYDVVVRTNGSIFLLDDKDFTRDYGKRIDVLYTNHQFYREMRPFDIKRFKGKGVKWLCMKVCKPEDKKELQNEVNIRVVGSVTKSMKCPSPNMGAIIFKDLLSYEPKELFITGIDFFASKKAEFQHDNYNEYVPGYLPPRIRRQGNRINKGKKTDGHDFVGNAKYIQQLFENNPNFKTHDFIAELLEGIVNGTVKQPR